LEDLWANLIAQLGVVTEGLNRVWYDRTGKGKEAKLSYIGSALTENRHGQVVEAELGSARGPSNARQP
jgi:hypothetical protein